MNQVEHLHALKTQAHSHLQSRKRKLAELYSQTVCVFAPNEIYRQQLRDFQDANDLQKGRRFDETTLPSRPHEVHQPRITRPVDHDSTSSPTDPKLIKTPLKSHVVRSSSVGFEGGGEAEDKPDHQNETTVRFTDQNRPLSHGDDYEAAVGDLDASTSFRPGRERPRSRSPAKPLDRDVVIAEASSKELQKGLGVSTKASASTDSDLSPALANGTHSSKMTSPSPQSTKTTSGGDQAPPDTDAKSVEGIMVQGSDALNNQNSTHSLDHNGVGPSLHQTSGSSLDIDMMDTDLSLNLESPIKAVVPKIEIQREATNKSKPPIRINTHHELGANFKPQAITSGALVETPAQMTAIPETARALSENTPVSAMEPSKRATRISSGTIQRKSVSQILGETPKASSPLVDSPISSHARDLQFSTSLGRSTDRDKADKDRSKLSTVVFAKPHRPGTSDGDAQNGAAITPRHPDHASGEDRDYLYTLFESKAYSSKQGNLTHLIQHAHKTITTVDHLVDYEYQAQCRILKRLYQLQSADRWALRQRKRAEEPVRSTSHWDYVLDHAKWMHRDFREERKWKRAAARAMAEDCAEFVASDRDSRRLLQVRARPPKRRPQDEVHEDVDMHDEQPSSHPTPDLIASGEDDSISVDVADPQDIMMSPAPAALFSLGPAEFNFLSERTVAFDKMINELPLYQPVKLELDPAKSNLAEKMDARWKTDIVPVSRFVTEKLKVKEPASRFRRSRYEYELETSPPRQSTPLPPRDTNVGLFMPENKHIRDRIHPGHSFRPPSEHPMPTQAFFQTRTSSQWTVAEDDELRRLVKDYSYNWSLISSYLTPRSLYTSSMDRRTPWECFERWIGLEGMPADMAKTPYFRTYSGRIEAATRDVQAQLEEAQRRGNVNPAVAARKRTTQPVRVDRKRAQRHLAMLDAMRKLAKKRETIRQKAAHSADMAAMRKSNEVTQQRLQTRTPAEWSSIKHDRDQKMAKQQELYRQQLIAHQRAATAQQRAPNGVPNGIPQFGAQNVSSARAPNGIAGSTQAGQLAVPNGVPRPHPAMMGVSNGMPMAPGMAIPKSMQAQLQANMRNGMANTPQHIRMQQEQLIRQQQAQQAQQVQQNGQHSSPSSGHANSVNGHSQGFDGAGGQPSPPGALGSSSSPRQPQALSSGVVPVLTQIATNIRQRFPNMTEDQIQAAASRQLTAWQQQATAAAAGQVGQRPKTNQAALNAAVGAQTAGAAAAAAAAAAAQAAAAASAGFPQLQGLTNEQIHQYNQRLRLQQQAQQHAVQGLPAQMPHNMIGQMGHSPVMNMSRPVSQHNNQQMSRSATPRDQRSGSLTNPTGTAVNNVNGQNGAPVHGVQHGQNQQNGSANRPVSQHAMQA